MKHPQKRAHVLRGREEGQALVEFALVGIALMLIIFGMIDVGRAVWNYNTLAQATREGTRYAIVHGADSSNPSGPESANFTPPSDDVMVRQTIEKFGAGLNPGRLTVESEWLDGDNQRGNSVKVTSSYDYQPMFNFFGALSFTLTSSSTMEITN